MRKSNKQTNKKQIPQSFCGYGAQGNSTPTWLWSEGGKPHAKAMLSWLHPITYKEKRERTPIWSLSSTTAASLGGCNGIRTPASQHFWCFPLAPNSYGQICMQPIERDNEASDNTIWSQEWHRLPILPSRRRWRGAVCRMGGLRLGVCTNQVVAGGECCGSTSSLAGLVYNRFYWWLCSQCIVPCICSRAFRLLGWLEVLGWEPHFASNIEHNFFSAGIYCIALLGFQYVFMESPVHLSQSPECSVCMVLRF